MISVGRYEDAIKSSNFFVSHGNRFLLTPKKSLKSESLVAGFLRGKKGVLEDIFGSEMGKGTLWEGSLSLVLIYYHTHIPESIVIGYAPVGIKPTGHG